MTNPLDVYLGAKEKRAGWFSGLGAGAKQMLSAQNIGGALAATAFAAATDVPGMIARKAYYAVTKSRDFNQMMETDPTLKQFQRENPTQFNSHYNSLRSLNPEFASDPVVAGTYMRQMSLNPATAGSVIVESLGGLPRPTQSTKARDLMFPDPMEQLRIEQLQQGLSIGKGQLGMQESQRRKLEEEVKNLPWARQKLMGDVAAQPGARGLTTIKTLQGQLGYADALRDQRARTLGDSPRTDRLPQLMADLEAAKAAPGQRMAEHAARGQALINKMKGL